jgi:small subunit ribosomal protein S19
MPREFLYRGRSWDQLAAMSLTEFMALLASRERRALKRGFTRQEQALLEKIRAGKAKLRTHAREMVIIPEMVGKTISVYTGKEFAPVAVAKEMLGHRLGEFALTRRRVQHSAPGIGATRSSAALSVR